MIFVLLYFFYFVCIWKLFSFYIWKSFLMYLILFSFKFFFFFTSGNYQNVGTHFIYKIVKFSRVVNLFIHLIFLFESQFIIFCLFLFTSPGRMLRTCRQSNNSFYNHCFYSHFLTLFFFLTTSSTRFSFSHSHSFLCFVIDLSSHRVSICRGRWWGSTRAGFMVV